MLNRPVSPTKPRLRPSASSSNLNLNLPRPQTPVFRRPASALSMRSPTPNQSLRRPTTPSPGASGPAYTGASAGTYSGNITVSVRVRPNGGNSNNHNNNNNNLNNNNNPGADQRPWEFDGDRNTIASPEVGSFQFDNVFHGETAVNANETVYNGAVKNTVEMVMSGYNGTVFAYGMTGSGKTYSMQGTRGNPGIIPLSINTIFGHIASKKDDSEYKVKVSYLEIYNEQLQDLLNPSITNDDIKLRDDPQRGVRAVGLSEHAVNGPQELLRLITKGDSMRRTEGTEFNSRSSRSHAVVQITVECVPNDNDNDDNNNNNNGDSTALRPTISTLYLCDLAGSERAAQQSERRKEGAFINKSLLTLGTIISRLSSTSTSTSMSTPTSMSMASASAHVPYRDSKLTRLLQPALSGKSIVSILCTIHPGNDVFTESLSTLRFAARAKNIVVSVKRNEDSLAVDPKVVEKLMAQIEMMKEEINELREGNNNKGVPTTPSGGSRRREPKFPLFSTVDSIKEESPEKAGSPNSSVVGAGMETVRQISQLEAENLILREQVEHYKRLAKAINHDHDIRTGEKSGSHGPDSQLELYHLREIEEYKSYITHLERQLHQQEATRTMNSHYSENSEQMVTDMNERIKELVESNKDKDRMISALRTVNKRRDMVSNGSHGIGNGNVNSYSNNHAGDLARTDRELAPGGYPASLKENIPPLGYLPRAQAVEE